jgi:hypothetical protein
MLWALGLSVRVKARDNAVDVVCTVGYSPGHSMAKQRKDSASAATGKRVVGRPFTGAGDPRLRQNMEAGVEEAEACQPMSTEKLSSTSCGSSESTESPTPPASASPLSAPSSESVRMRHVWERPKWRDRLPWEKNLRAWLEKDPRGYQMQMMALERAEVEKAAAGVEGATEADAGTVKCAELIEKLIKGLAAGE